MLRLRSQLEPEFSRAEMSELRWHGAVSDMWWDRYDTAIQNRMEHIQDRMEETKTLGNQERPIG
jgi:hypothetical protein